MERVAITISGKVIGVFFRIHIRDLAKDLGVTGYVKNTAENNLFLVAEGEKETIKKLIDFCKKGPKDANVENIKIEKEAFKNEFNDFLIEYE